MISQEKQKESNIGCIVKSEVYIQTQARRQWSNTPIRQQFQVEKSEKMDGSISSSHQSDIAGTNKSSTLQEAGSAECSYRPSILDEYQRQDYDRISKPCIYPQEENMQEKPLPPKKAEQIENRVSPRLTRLSSISPTKRSFQDSTNSILHMIAVSQKRKSSLLNTINEAVHCLSKGILLRKCCFNRFKIETVVLTFSEDFQFMSLFQIEKSKLKVYCMKDFVNILKGFKTHKFHEYLEKGHTFEEQSSFSILFKERSFDFLADSPQNCENIVSKIKLLNESA